MVTALILQLVQCIVTLPDDDSPNLPRPDTPTDTTTEDSRVGVPDHLLYWYTYQ